MSLSLRAGIDRRLLGRDRRVTIGINRIGPGLAILRVNRRTGLSVLRRYRLSILRIYGLLRPDRIVLRRHRRISIGIDRSLRRITILHRHSLRRTTLHRRFICRCGRGDRVRRSVRRRCTRRGGCIRHTVHWRGILRQEFLCLCGGFISVRRICGMLAMAGASGLVLAASGARLCVRGLL